MAARMYSPNSPVLSAIDHHSIAIGSTPHSPSGPSSGTHCLRFKYFATFFVCTTCLALLSASLATHKWLVSKPIRVLRLHGGQTNLTALMLTATQEDPQSSSTPLAAAQFNRRSSFSPRVSNLLASAASQQESPPQPSQTGGELLFVAPLAAPQQGQSNKFHGEIYFGLFSGVKVLNHGFGDRVSQLSVVQAFFAQSQKGDSSGAPQPPQLVNFRLWLLTLLGVVVALLFALIGSVFAIINFVMTPRGTLTGPVGLVVWNSGACFSCLLAIIAWLVEYFVRLKTNVLTVEEVQNGWTSENRSQFGYSFYFVVLAFVLHLVNIFLVSIVQFESWTQSKAAKRHSQNACEGVIMLY